MKLKERSRDLHCLSVKQRTDGCACLVHTHEYVKQHLSRYRKVKGLIMVA